MANKLDKNNALPVAAAAAVAHLQMNVIISFGTRDAIHESSTLSCPHKEEKRERAVECSVCRARCRMVCIEVCVRASKVGNTGELASAQAVAASSSAIIIMDIENSYN